MNTATEYNYAQQSRQPDWFDPNNALHVSATSGSSPFNEWYAFESRRQAVADLSGAANQSYVDNFVELDGEIYHTDDVDFDEFGNSAIRPSARPADLAEIVRAQSRF